MKHFPSRRLMSYALVRTSYLSLLCLAVLVGLSACTRVKTDVTRFSNMPGDSDGATFVFVPLDGQDGSLEFDTYARYISEKLGALGFVETNDLNYADYAVVFDYGVGGSRVVSGALPLYGQTGGGTTHHSGTVNSYGSGGSVTGSYTGQSYSSPTYGVTGYAPYSRTEHDRHFDLRLIDVSSSTDEKIISVYEGSVISAGSNATFAAVSNCLIDALFEDFYEQGTDSSVQGGDCIR